MKLKLDENLGQRGLEIFRSHGHDTSTVYLQNLASAPDDKLIAVCKAEGRCIVTLDLGFANPLTYKAADYPGIAVLRLPKAITRDEFNGLIHKLAVAFTQREIIGKLWIVQKSGIREYQPDN